MIPKFRISNRNQQYKFSGLFVIIIIVCSIPNLSIGQTDSDLARQQYIETFKQIAISEFQRTGVPASIKLAQGIVESDAGRSTLARVANNHFGIKCGGKWKGEKYFQHDDEFYKTGIKKNSCFRVFDSAEESYIHHSDFLRNPYKSRYDALFLLDPNDYHAWAYGLKKAGYATAKTYPQMLIKIIEKYELYLFDHLGSGPIVRIETDKPVLDVPVTPNDLQGQIVEINGLKVSIAMAGDTPDLIANRTNISIKRILRYNEDIKNEYENLDANQKIYIQPKRMSFRGRDKYHYVSEGEQLIDISKNYGIKLSSLAKRNRISENDALFIGQKIKLRGLKVTKKENANQDIKRRKVRKLKKDLNILPEKRKEEQPDDEMAFDDEVPELTIEDFIVTKEEPQIVVEDNVQIVEIKEEVKAKIPVVNFTKEEVSTSSVKYHYVVQGDTLYRISKKHGITVNYLKNRNRLSSNIIRVGQKLAIN